MFPVQFFLASSNSLDSFCSTWYRSTHFLLLYTLLTFALSRFTSGSGFFLIILWDKTIDTLEYYFLKTFTDFLHAHYLPMMWIYPWENFVDRGGLFYGTQELIFPVDAHGNFLPILHTRVPCNDHWAPEHYCKRWTHFRAGRGKRQVKHPNWSGYLLPECNRFAIPIFWKITGFP